MLELLDIRFSFYCRTTYTNAEGKHPIIFRITFRGERRDIFTGLHCLQSDWNSNLCRVNRLTKALAGLNDNLDLIERKAHEIFERFKHSGREFTIDELITKLKGKGEKPTLLVEYLEEEKEGLKKRLGVDISTATYDKYRRSASHVQLFLQQEFKVKNYALSRIDTPFLEKYFQYLRGTRKIGHNSSVKYVTFFKTILMPALREGIIPVDPFRQLRLRIKTIAKTFCPSKKWL